jgi:hypothetical protein
MRATPSNFESTDSLQALLMVHEPTLPPLPAPLARYPALEFQRARAEVEAMTRKRPLGDYGLSIILIGLFFLSWIGQFVTQAIEVSHEAQVHGQQFDWAEFWPAFWQATFENWQSEFLQLFSFVVLATYFVHRDSPQSRDGDDDMKEQLDRIEAHLIGLDEEFNPSMLEGIADEPPRE